jgi:hypothetical protein
MLGVVILGVVMLNVAAPEPPLPADFVPQRHETVGKWKKQTPSLILVKKLQHFKVVLKLTVVIYDRSNILHS